MSKLHWCTPLSAQRFAVSLISQQAACVAVWEIIFIPPSLLFSHLTTSKLFDMTIRFVISLEICSVVTIIVIIIQITNVSVCVLHSIS